MKSIPARSAVSNLTKGADYGRWSIVGPNSALNGYEDATGGMGGARVYEDFFTPYLSPKFKLSPEAKIFTSGSCFAREIEWTFFHQGFNVLSWNPKLELSNEFFHRYNTFSIINDFRNAFEGADFARFAMETPLGWLDYTANGVASTQEELIELRQRVSNIHLNIREADIFIITLGLVEVWFDKLTNSYLNAIPSEVLAKNLSRYECRITNYNENLDALQTLIAYIRAKVDRTLKIVLTVSPVPLNATFSGQDIVVANTYSKAVLRSVAQDICETDEEIDYFPSFEIVMNSSPAKAWLPDRRHVRREMVEHITRVFKGHYIRE